MTDTLFFLFLDEIYSPNLNEFKLATKKEIIESKIHRHFGLGGVIISASYLHDFYSKAKRIKNRYYPTRKNLIFHYVDMLNAKDDYSDLKVNIKKKRCFYDSVSDFIYSSSYKYVCVYIDKNELLKSYGIFDSSGKAIKIRKIGSNMFPKSPFMGYNLYLLCLKKLIISFYKYISDRSHPARGIIVAEARGQKEDTEMREAFYKIYENGVSSIQATELRRVILDIFIVPKTQNYIGTQIADLVLYPTYDEGVKNHNCRQDHFISFGKRLNKKLIGEVNIIP